MICVTFKKNFCSVANQNGGGRFFSSKIGQISTFAPSTYWVFFVLLCFFFLKIFLLYFVSSKNVVNLHATYFLHIMQTLVVGYHHHHHSFGDMSMFSGEVAAEVILTSSGTVVVVVGTAAATAAFKGGGSILPFPV